MNFSNSFQPYIFDISAENFESAALDLFCHQYNQCEIYGSYCSALGKHPKNVNSLYQIPFLPVELFKNHAIKSGSWKSDRIFKSSGTISSRRSHHHIRDINFYHEVTQRTYDFFFDDLAHTTIIAFLPSYREQGNSSLIAMMDHLMTMASPNSIYFPHNQKEISEILSSPDKKWIIGISFALLDLIQSNYIPVPVENAMIMETGGMKGRRKEITREELHTILRQGFGQGVIFSEYGMTELMSQAYGKNGRFRYPEWVKVLIRDLNDPFHYAQKGETGGLNIVDLANVDTCAFIETKDLGRLENDHFEVLGRYDNSDIRGCNLMIQHFSETVQ